MWLGDGIMKLKLLGLIACVALLGVSRASAATLVGTTSDATGIDGLVVDSVTYDVTFVHDSYDTVYASNTPTFLGNSIGGSDAATALVSALNSLAVQTLTGIPTGSEQLLLIPTQLENFGLSNDGFVVECNVNPCSAPDQFASTTYNNVTNATQFATTDYAVFVTATTPLPAALPLFATGLGGLGLLGWRRKRKAQAVT
jgi:hypothetical protein